MYRETVQEMATELVKAGLIRPDQAEAATDAMMKQWVDRIAIIWTRGDVQTVRRISDDDAFEVINQALRNHDASVGINYNVLEGYALYYPELPEDDEDE